MPILTEEGKWNGEMNKKGSICAYLKKHHTGARRAVHSKELEQLFSVDGRALRRCISALRQEGQPICSDSSGYYYAEKQEDINHTVARLNKLVTRIANARTGMLYASVIDLGEMQLEININVRREVENNG